MPQLDATAIVADRHGMEVMVRNALFARVRLAALGNVAELGRLDGEWGFGERRWREALEDFHAAHEAISIDGNARSAAYFVTDPANEQTDHTWHATQIFLDEEGDGDFRIEADVDLDATQETGEVVFKNFRVGFFEEL